ncbi:MAG: hypothetical protein GX596_14150 [Propionibacterium sp.]|nr:hypothetical protein [Propionibacterium sp.]
MTVIEQPADQLGLWAAQILLGRHGGNAASAARMVLEPQLHVRASSVKDPAHAVARANAQSDDQSFIEAVSVDRGAE